MAGTLKKRLDAIERLEKELIKKAYASVPQGERRGMADMFLMGATRRTLAQSRGFRQLIEGQNFPCATILLRTQIDTAMRINGLSLMGGNLERNLHQLFNGKGHRRMVSG